MKARVVAHRDFRTGRVDHRVYGAFLEHLGRAVYTGIYEPRLVDAGIDGAAEVLEESAIDAMVDAAGAEIAVRHDTSLHDLPPIRDSLWITICDMYRAIWKEGGVAVNGWKAS